MRIARARTAIEGDPGMNVQEQTAFLEATAEVAKLVRLAQIAVVRARSHSHADIYEHVDFMSKRLYELRVTSEWLQQRVKRWMDSGYMPIEPANRVLDRRAGIDRRIATMRKELLSPADITAPLDLSAAKTKSTA
jgi:hypothetical protein